jgi:serine/threonine protein kinase
MDLEAGKLLLHYKLTGKIGEGGMGVVWLARDTSLDRDVAIKVLPATFAADVGRQNKLRFPGVRPLSRCSVNLISLRETPESPETRP